MYADDQHKHTLRENHPSQKAAASLHCTLYPPTPASCGEALAPRVRRTFVPGELWGPTAEDGKKVGLGLQLMGLDTESVKLQLAPLGALNVDGLLASWNVGCSARGALRQGGSLQLGRCGRRTHSVKGWVPAPLHAAASRESTYKNTGLIAGAIRTIRAPREQMARPAARSVCTSGLRGCGAPQRSSSAEGSRCAWLRGKWPLQMPANQILFLNVLREFAL
ncbi:unnamed protein product [Rangifer tarandus platyrhynchus]|uniref:Uncharacterized protein n=1 Tax=Rangifer tarandus platyrhynchus TaxID=3082113 RepID=A0ABN8ZZ06_RANTA|nr:unnamed protein product [Rangifer tarandus platyrhynchus]